MCLSVVPRLYLVLAADIFNMALKIEDMREDGKRWDRNEDRNENGEEGENEGKGEDRKENWNQDGK